MIEEPAPILTANFGLGAPVLERRGSIPPIRLEEENCHVLTRDEYRFYVEFGIWQAEYHANWNI